MPKKTYRPKADAEALRITVQMGGDADGKTLDVGEGAKDSFPYATEDGREQQILDAHPLVTDQPAPKKEKSS